MMDEKTNENLFVIQPLEILKKQKLRECGECVACCVYYNIKDEKLTKEAMSPCSKLNIQPEKGEYSVSACNNCTLQNTPEKPKTCIDFNCYWLLGHGDENDRPDKSNIMIDRSKRIENSHEAKSLLQGAEDTPEGRATIERMSKSLGTPIIVLPFGELKIKRIVGKGL